MYVRSCASPPETWRDAVADARLRRPGSLEKNPRLSQWLRLEHDGTVSIFSGKVEIGQGILTALAQIAAEELELPWNAFAWWRRIPRSARTRE